MAFELPKPATQEARRSSQPPKSEFNVPLAAIKEEYDPPTDLKIDLSQRTALPAKTTSKYESTTLKSSALKRSKSVLKPMP